MDTKLYGMTHSHPAVAVRVMLELKGIEHEVRDIFPGLHPIVVRAAGFEGRTVPALRIDGHKLQGSLEISRALDEIEPFSPLFPADPELRRAVEDAERFGHDELQPLARRVFRFAALRSNEVRAWMAREVVGLPLPTLMGLAFKPVMVYYTRIVGASAEAVRRDLDRLPQLLDSTDSLLAEGVIGGPQPNAADCQILASVRLLLAHADLRALIEPRACGHAALALIPEYKEPIPAALPAGWLPSAPSSSPSAADVRRSPN